MTDRSIEYIGTDWPHLVQSSPQELRANWLHPKIVAESCILSLEILGVHSLLHFRLWNLVDPIYFQRRTYPANLFQSSGSVSVIWRVWHSVTKAQFEVLFSCCELLPAPYFLKLWQRVTLPDTYLFRWSALEQRLSTYQEHLSWGLDWGNIPLLLRTRF